MKSEGYNLLVDVVKGAFDPKEFSFDVKETDKGQNIYLSKLPEKMTSQGVQTQVERALRGAGYKKTNNIHCHGFETYIKNMETKENTKDSVCVQTWPETINEENVNVIKITKI